MAAQMPVASSATEAQVAVAKAAAGAKAEAGAGAPLAVDVTKVMDASVEAVEEAKAGQPAGLGEDSNGDGDGDGDGGSETSGDLPFTPATAPLEPSYLDDVGAGSGGDGRDDGVVDDGFLAMIRHDGCTLRGEQAAPRAHDCYHKYGFVKGAVEAVLGFVPVLGKQVKKLMSDQHRFRSSRGMHARELRLMGDVSNWVDSSYFINQAGLAIFYRVWLPKAPVQPRAIVVISHGLAEHSLRYENLATRLAAQNFAVYALDHQGHGCSEGDRLFVQLFDDFVEDVRKLTLMAKGRHPQVLRTFMIGHSLGGLIALNAAAADPRLASGVSEVDDLLSSETDSGSGSSAPPGLFDGVVLSSPAFKVETPPLASTVAPILAAFLPKLPSPTIDIATLCRDDSVVDRYANDSLVCRGYPSLRLSSEIVAAVGRVPEVAAGFDVPFLLMHGLDDRICLPQGSQSFFNQAVAKDKSFTTFPDSFHELFNEPDREENAIAVTLQWLDERC